MNDAAAATLAISDVTKTFGGLTAVSSASLALALRLVRDRLHESDEDAVELIDRARNLHSAIRRLDTTIYARPDAAHVSSDNPVERQLGLLKAAFEREAR